MAVQTFSVVSKEGTREMTVHFDTVIAVGFAGRDQAAVKHHIDELAEIGVRPPSKTPIMYPCSTNSLVRSEKLQVIGRETSGEVEFLLVLNEGEIYIGIGSDHTDRGLETVGISKAKQICGKPLGPVLWPYAEVKDHWDQIKLQSWQRKDGKEFIYQDGTVGGIMKVEDILAEVKKDCPNVKNAVLFSGTVGVKDGFVYGDWFRCELTDPVLGRKLSHEYVVEVIGEGLE